MLVGLRENECLPSHVSGEISSSSCSKSSETSAARLASGWTRLHYQFSSKSHLCCVFVIIILLCAVPRSWEGWSMLACYDRSSTFFGSKFFGNDGAPQPYLVLQRTETHIWLYFQVICPQIGTAVLKGLTC